jgi:glutamine---fructose-6-phosphate transaminase (isomerizing)
MCGIFGLFVKPESDFSEKDIRKLTSKLALMSESRGKDSSGVACFDHEGRVAEVTKGDIRIRKLMQTTSFQSSISNSLERYKSLKRSFSVFGHARLVTNGSQLQTENNQPVIKDGNFLIHNGIIVNAGALWESHPELDRKFKIDSEIILSLMDQAISLNPQGLGTAVTDALSQLEGTYSILAFLPRINKFILATNNGSLYFLTDNTNYLIFGSEAYYLKKLLPFIPKKGTASDTNNIRKVNPNQALFFEFPEWDLVELDSSKDQVQKIKRSGSLPFQLKISSVTNPDFGEEIVIEPEKNFNRNKEKHLFDLLENQSERIENLKRCSKCILPETFPFISFDNEGVCNYCRNYIPKSRPKKLDSLRQLIEPYRKNSSKADCIVPFSGGRDSTFALHMVKKELGLNPIAFTYDWGMVTDLARRNISRVCGKLGVENVVVAADIHWKRQNIRKNIEAWLRKPALGMIPLFMAGDKYFFYYTDRLKKQMGIDLNIWGVNHLENTDFKTGFAGLKPEFEKERIFSLSIANQLKLFGFVGKEVLSNPAYINQSIWDSCGSFAVRYVAPKKDYFQLFDYYPWNENEVNELILSEYNWEKSPDTDSTWRIGDGTAGFYNYIYHTVAGFSEVDTFRSNQIREGLLSRKVGLKLAEEENSPRFETIRWYLEIIGIDFQEAIKKINDIPKLYS